LSPGIYYIFNNIAVATKGTALNTLHSTIIRKAISGILSHVIYAALICHFNSFQTFDFWVY